MYEDTTKNNWQMGEGWYALVAESYRLCMYSALRAHNDTKFYDEWYLSILMFAQTTINLCNAETIKEYENERNLAKGALGNYGSFQEVDMTQAYHRNNAQDRLLNLMNFIVRQAYLNKLLINTTTHYNKNIPKSVRPDGR